MYSMRLILRQNSLPAMAEDTYDFLMCRMFHKNIRRYVKVEFLSSIGLHFNDFLRAGMTFEPCEHLNNYIRWFKKLKIIATASKTFDFNISSFDHFVDQDGYRIESKDFINVITSDACRNNFAVGFILSRGWYYNFNECFD